jgi:glycosyltransferase involved in cell wall biosynthesis
MKNKVVGSIVVPAFNEEEGIEGFLNDLKLNLTTYSAKYNIDFKVIIVDDGSVDQTSKKIGQLIEKKLFQDSLSLQLITLTRNFGHQAALITGLREAALFADFVITIDADGEHPIVLIPKLIEEWFNGHDIVHTQRISSHKLPLFKKLTSYLYYQLINFVSNVDIKPGMADFKLWDGSLLKQVRDFLPECGSTRIFASWVFSNGAIVEYKQNIVEGRISRFSFIKMLRMGMSGLFRYSDWPLRFAMIFGLTMTFLSCCLAIFAISSYFMNQTVSGWTSLVVLVSFFGGVTSLLIGLLSEYLLRFSLRTRFPFSITSNKMSRSIVNQ